MTLKGTSFPLSARYSAVAIYGFAAAISAVAILLRSLLAPYLTGAQFITFYPAVVLAAYFFGPTAGLLTVGLCGIAGWYFFVAPLHSFGIEDAAQAVTLVVYFVTAAAIAVLIGALREAIQSNWASTDALMASEEQFRILADSSPALIWVTDENAQVTFANRRYEEVFGTSADSMEGDGWRGIMHSEDIERFNAKFLQALVNRERFIGETRVVDRNGQTLWLHCEGVPRFTPDGTFLGYVGANLDITDAKRAEEQLRELNQTLERRIDDAVAERKLLADLVEGTDAFVQVADLDYRWLAINKSAADEFERIYGVRPQVGDSMLELLAAWPQHQAEVRAVWSRALAGEAFTGVGEFGDQNRERRSYEMKYHVLLDETGKQIGAYQFVYDVTERVGEQRLLAEAIARKQDSDALYRAYFENSPESLFVIGIQDDGDFVIEQINPAHEASVGFKSEDVAGRRIEDVLPPQEATKVLPMYRQVRDTGQVYHFREVFVLNDGPQHWDTSIVPMVDSSGRVIKLIGSSRNVTRQVMAEEALRQSQKMEAMGQLTGGVAHDFNNLLTPILGSLDLLQRKGLGDERDRRLLDAAMFSAERAKTLVQRLLAFARRQPLQTTAVDVGEMIEGLRHLLESTIGPRISLSIDVPRSLPAVAADENQLEMALLNLAVNARDAMVDGGELSLTSRVTSADRELHIELNQGNYVCLSVTDTGTGMDEITQAKAVEPFFSTKGVGQGTGLGLSMVHGLAAQLGGALAIDSEVGRGTRVNIYLPISAEAVSRNDAPRQQELVRPDQSILLVDDEPLIRMSTADMLTDLGYDVIEANSAEDALRIAGERQEFDILVTDHLMPGISGVELANQLRDERPGLPVLVISGYANIEGIDATIPRLVKPFRLEELAAKLADLTKR